MRYSEVYERLQNLTNSDVSMYQIAKVLNVPTSKIKYRRDADANFSREEIEKLDAYYKQHSTKFIQEFTSDDDNIMLDYFPEVEISCGNGIEPLNGRKELITVSKNVIQGFSKSATYTVVNAVSDSMQPEIQPKDLLVVQHYTGEQIKDNHIYIFIYEGALYCKYLSNNLGQIIVKSANADYPTRYIEKEQMDNFYLIGEVKGFIRDYSG